MTPSFTPQILPDRALLLVTGEHVLAFLQGLVTCDVAALSPGHWAYGALLSPQGKILHEVFIIHDGTQVWIDCVAAEREALFRKLILYRLRSKISIATPDDVAVAVGQGGLIAGDDPRNDSLGQRAVVRSGPAGDASNYHVHRIALGIADGAADIGSDHMFPHEANFDLLHGVSFTKGCYVGQEVVSRMQHRGTARNRILPVTAEDTLPAMGSEVRSGDKLTGILLSSAGSFGLALIRLDRLAESSQPLLSETVRLHVHKPDWMSLDISIPESAE